MVGILRRVGVDIKEGFEKFDGIMLCRFCKIYKLIQRLYIGSDKYGELIYLIKKYCKIRK